MVIPLNKKGVLPKHNGRYNQRNLDITENELHRFTEAFHSHDLDEDNELSWDESLAAFEALNIRIAPLHLMLLRRYLIPSDEDRISLDQFISLLRAMKQLYRLERAEYDDNDINIICASFRLSDIRNEGIIGIKETIALVNHIDPKLSKQAISEQFVTLDIDRSGYVDFAEFIMLIRALFPKPPLPKSMIGRSLDRYPSYENMKFRNSDITKEEYQTFLTLFRLLDDDKDRLINKVQAESAFNLMGIKIHRIHFYLAWIRLDSDQDGRITFQQYIGILRIAKQIFRIQQAGFDDSYITSMFMAFAIADYNNDGLLQQSDLVRLFQTIQDDIPPEQVISLFKHYDSNNLGSIDMAEFLMISRQLYSTTRISWSNNSSFQKKKIKKIQGILVN